MALETASSVRAARAGVFPLERAQLLQASNQRVVDTLRCVLARSQVLSRR